MTTIIKQLDTSERPASRRAHCLDAATIVKNQAVNGGSVVHVSEQIPGKSITYSW